MIEFRNVWFRDHLSGAQIEDVSFKLPAHEHRALLCRSPAEKQALLQLISGQSEPDRGTVSTPASLSFPLGSNDVLHSSFSTIDNAKLLGRLYGVSVDDVLAFVGAMIGEPYDPKALLNALPVSIRVGARLALSYAVPFDHYLAENIALPPINGPAYRNMLRFLEDLDREKRGLLLLTDIPARALDACTQGSILENGKITHFDDIKNATKSFGIRIRETGERFRRSDEVDL